MILSSTRPHPPASTTGGTLRVPVTQTAAYTRAPSLMAEGWTDVHASSSTPPPNIQCST